PGRQGEQRQGQAQREGEEPAPRRAAQGEQGRRQQRDRVVAHQHRGPEREAGGPGRERRQAQFLGSFFGSFPGGRGAWRRRDRRMEANQEQEQQSGEREGGRMG